MNIFELLPQLLLYPNEKDPLNVKVGVLKMQDINAYEQKVKGEFINACPKLMIKIC